MTITCPVCGLSKTIADERGPQGPVRINCPRCLSSFAWPPVSAWAEATPPGMDAALLAKAGFWMRAAAAAIDSVLVSLLQLMLGALLGMLAGLLLEQRDVSTVMALGLFHMVISATYYVFFTGYCGQTPGKMALRMRVIRTDGGELGYLRAFVREVPGKFLSSVLLGIGYLMVAFDSQKQGLHDKLAQTYVVKL